MNVFETRTISAFGRHLVAEQAGHDVDIARRSEPLEDGPRGSEVPVGSSHFAPRDERLAVHHAAPGALVWQLDLLPLSPRPVEDASCLRMVADGELHSALGGQRRTDERRPLELRCERFELRGRQAGRLHITLGQRDLDPRRQIPSPPGLIGLGAAAVAARERALDGPGGFVEVTLGELEERQARLCVVPMLVGLLEGVRSGSQVAHPQPDFADLIVGEADAVHDPEELELLRRVASFLFGLRPAPAEHLQLRPMDPADPRIAADRLAMHPTLGLIDPLRSPAIVAHVPASGDGVAIDIAGPAHADLAGRCRCGRLVDEGQSILPVAPGDLDRTLEAQRQCMRVSFLMGARDLDGAVEVRRGIGQA